MTIETDSILDFSKCDYAIIMDHSSNTVRRKDKEYGSAFFHYVAFMVSGNDSYFEEFDEYLCSRKKEETRKSGRHDFLVRRIKKEYNVVRLRGQSMLDMNRCYTNMFYSTPYYHEISFKDRDDEVMRMKMSLNFSIGVYDDWVTKSYYEKAYWKIRGHLNS